MLTSLLRDLPIYLLSLPILLLAFSVHESAHGYVAFKLGDPTARNLGRITLNPVKHLDLLGTICMLVAHVGWAKPVPINTRNFSNPKRDMAITGAAGPVSNLALSLIFLIILRISMFFIADGCGEEALVCYNAFRTGSYQGSLSFTILSLLVYLLYLGVLMNISLAVFNLIPVPPFDGSRIFYAFLPSKWYFGVMKYERVIMIVFLVLFALGALSGPLSWLLSRIAGGLFTVTGLSTATEDGWILNIMLYYVEHLIL